MEHTLRNGATVNDRRGPAPTGPAADCRWGFVVFTDSFMSGWGGAANGRSLYALEVSSPSVAELVLANGKRRSEMKRGRIVRFRKGGWLPNCRINPGDHLSIVDREPMFLETLQCSNGET